MFFKLIANNNRRGPEHRQKPSYSLRADWAWTTRYVPTVMSFETTDNALPQPRLLGRGCSLHSHPISVAAKCIMPFSVPLSFRA